MKISIEIKDQIFIIYDVWLYKEQFHQFAIRRNAENGCGYTIECFEEPNLHIVSDREKKYIPLYKEAIKKFKSYKIIL